MNLQLTGSDLPDAAAAQYAVAASASLQERRPRTLKHGDMFGVFDPRGDILPGEGSPDGLYWRDTRYLSQLDFSLGGAPPMLLSSNLRDDNHTLTFDLTNPDLFADGAVVLERDLIHIRRSKLVWSAGCFERLAFHNFARSCSSARRCRASSTRWCCAASRSAAAVPTSCCAGWARRWR
jgi:glycogen debranching enzyme